MIAAAMSALMPLKVKVTVCSPMNAPLVSTKVALPATAS